MLLNQQQQQATDQSTFALTTNRPPHQQLSKGKAPLFSRFSQRGFSPKPSNGFSSPRPFFHQYNRGPQQYNISYDRNYGRGNSQFNNHQYPRNPTLHNNQGTNSFPRQINQGPLQQGNNFSHGSRAHRQICGRPNHLAIDCFHRMHYAFQGRNPFT